MKPNDPTPVALECGHRPLFKLPVPTPGHEIWCVQCDRSQYVVYGR